MRSEDAAEDLAHADLAIRKHESARGRRVEDARVGAPPRRRDMIRVVDDDLDVLVRLLYDLVRQEARTNLLPRLRYIRHLPILADDATLDAGGQTRGVEVHDATIRAEV